MTKKKKKSVPRNPYALPAKKKTSAGAHKNKSSKRAEENKTPDYTEE